MPLMKGKIKNFFGFIGRAWSGGIRGKFGIIACIFACFIFLRIFWGTINVQTFVMNIWRMNNEQATLNHEQERLETLNRHIDLLKHGSSDYVEEIGLKYLNIGDSKYKILKI